MKQVSLKKELILHHIVATAIACVLIGYVVKYRSFAEINVQLPFLSFPIFIGELLIAFCLVCSVFKFIFFPINVQKNILWIAGVYAAFVLGKALLGYLHWGPLALRNAALFYYPIFIFFGYIFFKPEFLKDRYKMIISIVIILIFAYGRFHFYWTLTLLLLAATSILTLKKKLNKFILLGFILALTPFRRVFNTVRMMLVANTVSLGFIGAAWFYISKLSVRKKIIILCVSAALLVAGMYKMAVPHKVKSMLNVGKIIETYHHFNDLIEEKRADHLPRELGEVRLYNPESLKENQHYKYEQRKKELIKRELTQKGYIKDLNDPTLDEEKRAYELYKKKIAEENSYESQFTVSVNNIIFRFLIWRDMFKEMRIHKPIFGFRFGKPLRSESLEILNWAKSEWARDGWVAAHNSYFHFLYRGGILALIYLGVLGVHFLRMIGFFLQQKSMVGLVLCGVLLGWFVAANFLLILELPYTAIPIWVLYGATYAYKNHLKTSGAHEMGK